MFLHVGFLCAKGKWLATRRRLVLRLLDESLLVWANPGMALRAGRHTILMGRILSYCIFVLWNPVSI